MFDFGISPGRPVTDVAGSVVGYETYMFTGGIEVWPNWLRSSSGERFQKGWNTRRRDGSRGIVGWDNG
jgi:hypothetical protein